MENKNTSCEKVTDQSSNMSSVSEKMKAIKQQQKNKSDSKIISQKLNNHVYDRKLTLEHQIFRKEFVPVLKPIEIHLIPSKLRLNNLDLKHKRNKNNILSWSCPCSEDDIENDYKLDVSNSSFDNSDSSDLSNNVNNNNNNNDKKGLKDIRKKFTQLKSDSIHKVMTKKNLKDKKLSKQFNYFENNILSEEEKDESDKNSKIYKDSDEESFSLDLYEDNNNFNNYSMKPYDDNDNNKKTKLKQTKSSNVVNNSIKSYESLINNDKFQLDGDDNNNKKRNRIYSFSILDTLKNKLKIDK